MNINDMKISDFRKLPLREWKEEVGEFNSMVILPMPKKDLHDSGYRCMDFIAVKNGEPICRLSGCSDCLHIDGIGGYGYNWLNQYKGVPELIPASGWQIDCLKESGLLQIWPSSGRMICNLPLSSFEIYALWREKK